ncbi:MAG: flavodoxin domain-containing protein [Candidatus Aenigmarchaeota archaeon]|nr:flavodoxin domain-containing protein [Candidatus Aenigmarchaeota archaeon]
MKPKNTLITYATKHDSTKKCAEKLAEKLDKATIVNLKDEPNPDLSSYDTIIIGGPIYAGQMQKEVNTFCKNNLLQLKQKTIGLFICCMNDDQAELQLKKAFPEELYSLAIAKDSFGGEFNFEKMNFFEKIITRMIAKQKNSISKIHEDRILKFSNTIKKTI